ncbi:MAG: sigma-70 family RNA polymerase sigma factor [Bacteroidia bacterium]|nr:sigma-70 family RNA polymerase sigma factor [Bacteroidia bacterium]
MDATLKLKAQDDKSLVNAYINGNESAFEELLHRHKNRVFALIRQWISDKPLAEDLFQETFFKAIRTLKSGEYNEEGKFLSWLLRIARNVIIDYHRRNHRLMPADVMQNEDGEDFSLFELIIEKNSNHKLYLPYELKKKLRALVRELPKEQRDVVIQRIWLDMSFQEIAEFSGVSINTALGRMRYALINLRKLMEKHDLSGSFLVELY